MIDWPESLITELAARRCIIFIGSGVSAGAAKEVGGQTVRPPTWAGLLEKLLESCPEDQIGSKNNAQLLLNEEKYLDSAEIIRHACLPTADYHRIIESVFSGYSATPIH